MSDFWQEESDEADGAKTPQNVVDVLFRLKGSVIRVDHAWYLAKEIERLIPRFALNEANALHLLHVAESGNGWTRPDDSKALLHLSRRTRLRLRVAKECLADVEALVGNALILPDGNIDVGSSTTKPLVSCKVLFARYVVFPDAENEDQFLETAWSQLKGRGINTKKMLCGREQRFSSPNGEIKARSLMVANLDFDDSIKLQEKSLGEYRTMGCGIFMPHKGIDAVGDKQK